MLAPIIKSTLITLTSKIVLDSIAIFVSTVAIPRNVRIPNHTRATLARRCDTALILANPRRRNTETPIRNNVPILSDQPDQKPNKPSKKEITQNQTRETMPIRFWKIKNKEKINKAIIQNGSRNIVELTIVEIINTTYAAINIAMGDFFCWYANTANANTDTQSPPKTITNSWVGAVTPAIENNTVIPTTPIHSRYSILSDSSIRA